MRCRRWLQALVTVSLATTLLTAVTRAEGLARRYSQATVSDSLQPLAFLIGRWEGTSGGQPGVARVHHPKKYSNSPRRGRPSRVYSHARFTRARE